MLFQRTYYISVRFISKSFVRDKILPVANLYKQRAKELKILEKVELSVETDAKKLVSHVCGTNLLQEGGEDVKIKPDSEYPSWLKEIGLPKSLEEIDPNTKAYWRKLKKLKKKEMEFIKSITKIGTVHK